MKYTYKINLDMITGIMFALSVCFGFISIAIKYYKFSTIYFILAIMFLVLNAVVDHDN